MYTFLLILSTVYSGENVADTFVMRNDTIQEVVVTAQSPRQRVEAVQVGAEQLQMK